jgi:hypothetical protein
LALDTSPDIEEAQIVRWRLMSPAHKAATISGLTQLRRALGDAGPS